MLHRSRGDRASTGQLNTRATPTPDCMATPATTSTHAESIRKTRDNPQSVSSGANERGQIASERAATSAASKATLTPPSSNRSEPALRFRLASSWIRGQRVSGAT